MYENEKRSGPRLVQVGMNCYVSGYYARHADNGAGAPAGGLQGVGSELPNQSRSDLNHRAKSSST